MLTPIHTAWQKDGMKFAINARVLRAIPPWMDLPLFIGETLSLHPTPKVLF